MMRSDDKPCLIFHAGGGDADGYLPVIGDCWQGAACRLER